MADDKQTQVRKRIGFFYEKNKHLGKAYTVTHFIKEDIPRRTIYKAIKRVDNSIDLNRKPGSGHYRQINQKTKDKIIEKCVNEVGVSDRAIGREFNITGQYVKKILNEAQVIKKKRKKGPKSDENQKIRQKKRILKLSKTLFRPSNGI